MDIQKHKAADYPHVFRKSNFYIASIYIMIVLIVFGMGVMIFYIFNGYLLLIYLFIMAIELVFDFGDYISLLNNPYLIKLNSKGVWTKKTDFQPWYNVEKIYFRPRFSFFNVFDFNNSVRVFIYLKKPKKKVLIHLAGIKNQESLKELLIFFMKH